jgi:ABC-2 type transport system ATP-binding protein
MIEVVELTKRYGAVCAVDGLTFTVRPGHVTGFLGPNGAGKSTTMRMILGLDAPTSGRVSVNGHAYGAIRRPLHQVGAVLEVRAVHPGRSAYSHLLCLAQSNGIAASRVSEVLSLVGLNGVARRRAGKFSLGMSQRLGLAAALLGDPPILLCDEPVNGLDPEGILWIRTLLRDLAAEGRTVFVSSHLMSEMALTADHLIVIGHGKLLADGHTADIIAANSSSYVLVRTADPAALTDVLSRAGAAVTAGPSTDDGEPGLQVSGLEPTVIGDLAARHGLAVHELTPRTASLEAAYMRLTREYADYQVDTRSLSPDAHLNGDPR